MSTDKRTARPWGFYDILDLDDTHQTKSITILPGEQLSYQSHDKRSEHWVIVSGSGDLTLDGVVSEVTYGEHIWIPVGSKHRLKNTGRFPLVFIEVQVGTSFDENDIVRYSDDYGRASHIPP